MRVTQLMPVDGFCAEMAAAAAIIGVGSVHRLAAVTWGGAKKNVMAWVLTISGAPLVSGGVYLVFALFGKTCEKDEYDYIPLYLIGQPANKRKMPYRPEIS